MTSFVAWVPPNVRGELLCFRVARRFWLDLWTRRITDGWDFATLFTILCSAYDPTHCCLSLVDSVRASRLGAAAGNRETRRVAISEQRSAGHALLAARPDQ